MTPKMRMAWEVLESAKDAGIADIVAACRRAIVANRLGRRIAQRDIAMIRDALECIRAA